MMPYRIEVRKPAECRDSELKEFVRMDGEAGEVVYGLKRRVRGAACLTMLFVADQTVGTAAIKHPDLSYRTEVFRKAGLENEAAKFHYELRWIHIQPDHQVNVRPLPE
jgi:hypothetical protein